MVNRMNQAVWGTLDYGKVRAAYDLRIDKHHDLKNALERGDVNGYVPSALGIDDRTGNYSAWFHSLGQRIRGASPSASENVFTLAKKLLVCRPSEMTNAIYDDANIPNLKISVGSEMALMLQPNECWCTNHRTVFAHFVIQRKGNVNEARQDLQALGGAPPDYPMWRHLHYPQIGESLSIIAKIATEEAVKQNVDPGHMKFLWADSTADQLYARYS